MRELNIHWCVLSVHIQIGYTVSNLSKFVLSLVSTTWSHCNGDPIVISYMRISYLLAAGFNDTHSVDILNMGIVG